MAAPQLDSLADALAFTPVSGHGFLHACEPPPSQPGQPIPTADCPGNLIAGQVAPFQAVPLTNGVVRMFVEGAGTDNVGRVMCFDSQDRDLLRHRLPSFAAPGRAGRG